MRIFILGHFGGNQKFYDGQTVKTLSLYQALKDLGSVEVTKIDTYYAKTDKFGFAYELLKNLISTRAGIVLLSKRGRNIIFPLLWIFCTFFRSKIFHFVIGGNLEKEFQNDWIIKYTIPVFEKNWVESKEQAKNLRRLGLENASYLPNFKNISILSKEQLILNLSSPFKFCTFSRVMKEKGILEAIKAVMEIKKKGIDCYLDIYGSIDENFRVEFEQELTLAKGTVFYKGVVSPSDSVEIIKNYYLVLFPTSWGGEGLPGTVIDAFSSGVPVVAKKWPHCDEIIEDRMTGLLYDSIQDLPKLIEFAVNNTCLVLRMKYHCLNKANEYDKTRIVKEIFDEISKVDIAK